MHYQTPTTLFLASTLALNVAGAAVPLGMKRLLNQQVLERDLEVSPNYDEDHSQHWNYHKGYVNKDGHGHGPPHRRASPRSTRPHARRTLTLLPGDGDLIESDDYYGDEGLEIDLRKRHSHSSSKSGGKKGGAHSSSGVKVVADINLREREKRHDDWDPEHSVHWNEHHGNGHHHHHKEKRHHVDGHVHGHYDSDGHWHEYHHKRDEHVHVHEHDDDDYHHHHHHHDRREEEVESKKKSKKKGSEKGNGFVKKTKGKSSEGKKKTKSSKSGKKEEKRGTPPAILQAAGTPGFVEVATTLFNSTLARSIAGLVFSTNPDAEATEGTAPASFLLGTSTAQSTQFYLTPDPSGGNAVNIRVPVLNAQQLSTTDYCATFDLAPPSPLSLQPCGAQSGYSQAFAYNADTSELQPLYASMPAPMAMVDTNSLMEKSRTLATAATDSTPPDTSNSTASTTATSSPVASPTSTSINSGAPSSASNTTAADSSSSNSTSSDSDAQTISLYFVPASTYYQAPVGVQSLFDTNGAQADSSDSGDSSSTSVPVGNDGSSDGIDPSDSMATSTAVATSTETATVTATSTLASSDAMATPTVTPTLSTDSLSSTASLSSITDDSTLSTVTVSPSATQSATQSGTMSARFGRW